jgi:acetylornithine deacetylase/succinyl-diaminopimelate desuccinylase-like protein
MSADQRYAMAVRLLQKLIAVPSFSREEDRTALILEDFFREHGIPARRKGNNVWAQNKFFDPSRPTILLNSHHDTVRPNSGYTRDPFSPDIDGEKLYGLGSNDAGGALASLAVTFLHYFDEPGLSYNLVMLASAEEEISGANGIESVWHELPEIDFAIVGEPTLTEFAIAEKGLLVLDCIARGKAGHAAREEGVNALYLALGDIEWFRNFEFPKISPTLGKIKMSVTVIQAGQAHNQVPVECRFTVDVRVTDAYSLTEVLEVIRQHVACEVTPRSLRLQSSGLPGAHPLLAAGTRLGKRMYGSPTTSDQALIPVPSLKTGPGDSARSHSADEFIFLAEIRDGITTYLRLLEELMSMKKG